MPRNSFSLLVSGHINSTFNLNWLTWPKSIEENKINGMFTIPPCLHFTCAIHLSGSLHSWTTVSAAAGRLTLTASLGCQSPLRLKATLDLQSVKTVSSPA